VALCDVDYVRSQIFSNTLTDDDITDIITETGADILVRCGTTSETEPLIILAGKYAILAACLMRMKQTGELAASVQTANASRQNITDIDIERYLKKSEYFIGQYNSACSSVYTNPTFNCGFGSHVHHGGHHGHN
jgi:hypothetical protein